MELKSLQVPVETDALHGEAHQAHHREDKVTRRPLAGDIAGKDFPPTDIRQEASDHRFDVLYQEALPVLPVMGIISLRVVAHYAVCRRPGVG